MGSESSLMGSMGSESSLQGSMGSESSLMGPWSQRIFAERRCGRREGFLSDRSLEDGCSEYSLDGFCVLFWLSSDRSLDGFCGFIQRLLAGWLLRFYTAIARWMAFALFFCDRSQDGFCDLLGPWEPHVRVYFFSNHTRSQ